MMKNFRKILSDLAVLWVVASLGLLGCQSRSVIQKISAKQETQVQYSIQETHLENGLKVVWIEDPSLPWVSLSLLIRSGTIDDGGTGLNFLTAQLLDQGAGSLNAQQFARAIEQTGSSVSIQAGYDFSLISIEGLENYRGRFLDLFWDMVTAPRFQTGDLDRKRKEIIAEMIRTRDNPGQRMDELFERQVFGEHPYGGLPMGSEASLEKITRQAVVKHFQKFFTPDHSVLMVAGRFDASYKQAVVERFTRWAPVTKGPAKAETKQEKLSGGPGRKVLYTRAGLRQSQIRVGGLSVSRAHVDVIPLRLAISTLGGGSVSTSRLMSRLRSDQGLTYGAYAWNDARRLAGIFSIGTSTVVKNTTHVLNEIQDIFTEFCQKGVTQREFAASQAQALGQFPKAIETSSRFARQYLSFIGLGMEGDEIIKFPAKVASLNQQSVNEVIRRQLAPMPLHIAILGPPELAKEPALAGFEVIALN
jgi:zinc protease